ncbi:PhoD-like phosphatase family protein [Babesia bovis T2Bo]|uniref:PhoD-like phosphatase family protein n=1 Tax=Babesia bovis T2Bo TaxID=484906 RepID=UPI001C3664D5|nr:PhoD-like phosphatase family protein [Babesia bovis T2Bo]KAG6440192.1 PhoD-like phosphatase family protein [Babesia bovis T2Bo]
MLVISLALPLYLLQAAICCADRAVPDYEARYGTQLVPLKADEHYNEKLSRLAFGSCQKLHLGNNGIFQRIIDSNPDLFLYTGDIVYPEYGCCSPKCLQSKYEQLVSHPVYQHFKANIRRIDGVYDDHDLGINDGHANYRYKKEALEQLLDFLGKPKDHYRRKREGAYYSAEYVDPATNKKVKIIVLDVRYHRACFYYCTCQKCNWYKIYMYTFVIRRIINYYFGFGCNHPGDALGKEQWEWLQGQLYKSDADSHIIISSMQVFTYYPITESWGLLPQAKDRLVDLLLAAKPKNTVFVSGDVHWGEIMERDGIVEITSSSLTHSLLLEAPMLKIPMIVVSSLWKKSTYGYNNFGIIDFDVNKENGNITQEVKLMDEYGNVLQRSFNDGSSDPLEPYIGVKYKENTFLNNTRIVKCTSLKWKFGLLFSVMLLVACSVAIVHSVIRSFIFARIKYRTYKVD